MTTFRSCCWVIAMLPALLAGPALATPTDVIRAAAETASPFSQSEALLDPRLRVAPCEQPLDAVVSHATASQATIQVRCPQPTWQLYVPVRARGQQTVMVLRHAVAAGHRLTETDVMTAERSAAGLGYGAYSTPQALVGQQTRRALPAGRVLGPGDLSAPALIRRGETVTLFVARGPVMIRMPGEALADGAEGARIRVRNTRSGRHLDGVVSGPGQVEIRG